ncbi:MAG: CarD family transcriptional regulator [Spirochaetota bacterium]
MSTSTKTPEEPQFKEKDHVVYPLQGVGLIQSVEERDFQDKKLLYYVIYLEVTDMTVMVPVQKAEELGIRAIVPPEEADEALTLISEEYEPVTADWKMRYQMNLDLLKKGSVSDIATVVRTLYHRSKIKELPILERKLFDNALRLLVDEVSFSLEKPKSEVEQLVFGKLETEHPPKPAEEDEHDEESETAGDEAEPVGDDDDGEAPVEEGLEEEE